MVSIRDLQVSTVIGVYDWEREIEQALTFSVDMASDVAKAASRDDLRDALDYSAVAHTVKCVVIEGKYQLIETAVERVAERLVADFGLAWVRVQVVKPITSEGYTAAITIERGTHQAKLLLRSAVQWRQQRSQIAAKPDRCERTTAREQSAAPGS
jgi:7,8-dihydroneopterin aldolase/epimerase/oxygenase